MAHQRRSLAAAAEAQEGHGFPGATWLAWGSMRWVMSPPIAWFAQQSQSGPCLRGERTHILFLETGPGPGGVGVGGEEKEGFSTTQWKVRTRSWLSSGHTAWGKRHLLSSDAERGGCWQMGAGRAGVGKARLPELGRTPRL